LKEKYITTDVLVIGGGGSALRAAIEAASVNGVKTCAVSKSIMGSGNTRMSTGNFCVALDPPDSTEIHFADTIKGGGYINNQKIARRVVENGPQQLLTLERFGAMFRRKGEFLDHLEGEARGGHSYPRGRGPVGEGLGIIRTLGTEALRLGIESFEEAMVTRLLLDKKGGVAGATAIDIRTGTFLVFNAKVVVLAAGGAGQIYLYTTNSNLNTGDGYALAYRAGAELLDMEMVQFIPFCFVYPDSQKGRMVGEGGHYPNAKLLNKNGERFMERYDPKRLEKSTRDTVSRSIFLEILEGRGTESSAVWLDNRGAQGLPFFKDRYPIMYKRMKDFYGLEEAEWLKPFEIMPGVHYFMGGVRMENYRSSLDRLFVVGENAGGVHGGNRLGGNSMLDIMVSGALGGKEAALSSTELDLPAMEGGQIKNEKDRIARLLTRDDKAEDPYNVVGKIKKLSWENAGLVRNGKALQAGIEEIGELREGIGRIGLRNRSLTYNLELKAALEAENMLDVAEMVFRSALERTESRGAHYRSDFPMRNDAQWLKNVIVFMDERKMKVRTEDVELTFLRPERTA
jgi:succinate dehydrogenase/fumarate reductase flavoprotein subunit